MTVFVRGKRAFSVLMLFGVASVALSIAGCGGDDEATADATGTNPPASGGDNRAPTISGSPLTSVLAGNAYSFTPNASDADGNSLTFSVSNLPSWANFNASTGRVSGTPSAAQVGTYSNIGVAVSDGIASANLATFSIQVVATATGSAMLTWNPPTQNTDGSALTNLAGYKVYWGTSQSNYTNSVTISNPGLSSYVVDQLTPATWYFALTAVNSSGAESSFSNIASKQVL
jgi:hypothetical protein